MRAWEKYLKISQSFLRTALVKSHSLESQHLNVEISVTMVIKFLYRCKVISVDVGFHLVSLFLLLLLTVTMFCSNHISHKQVEYFPLSGTSSSLRHVQVGYIDGDVMT